MIERSGFAMTTTVKEDFYQETDEFTHDQGFALALVLINEDDFEEPLDPAFGSLHFMVSSWATDENDKYYWRRDEIASHTCTQEELGLLRGDST